MSAGAPPSGDRPLRVLSVIPSMAQRTGGPATVMVHSTIAFGDRVERVIVCTDAGAPAAAAHRAVTLEDMPAGADELDIRVFPTKQPRKIGYSPGLGRFLRAKVGNFDLVTIHSLNLYPQYAAYRAAMAASVPYLVVPHGALDPWLRSQRRLRKAGADLLFQRRMLQRASAVQFTTVEEARRAGVSNPRGFVVPNGVSLEAVSAPAGAGARFRAEHGIASDELLVTFLGRIAAKKGLDILIRAFAASAITGRLLVVGPDDEGLTVALRQVAAEAGVVDRVHFAGPLYGDERAAALAATDIWALTSHTENFGNAVVEAMAASCPVVVSNGVNIAADIAAANAGFVVEATEVSAAQGLSRLAADPSLRAGIAERGRQFAERYSWPIVSRELIALYRAVSAGATGVDGSPALHAVGSAT